MSRSRSIVILLIASFVAAGLLDSILGSVDEIYSPVFLPHALTISILCFAWCKADAEGKGVAVPRGSPILCALIPMIGIPLHLYRTRPVRGATLDCDFNRSTQHIG